jgi:hypothetical protein
MTRRHSRRNLKGMARSSIFIATITLCTFAAADDLSTPPPLSSEAATRHATAYSPTDITADLGGVVVHIPRHFAAHVEFSGEKYQAGDQWKVPASSTTTAKLASFGFSARYPDMAGRSTPQLEKEFLARPLYRTNWIDVGLISGGIYPGTGFLDRRAKALNNPWRPFIYVEQPDEEYGLKKWTAIGVNPATKQPYRLGIEAGDEYISRDGDGHVLTHIVCNNSPHEAAPCRHTFSLEPQMKVKVEVGYRRGMLPEWRSIQDSVSRLLLSFQLPTKPREIGPHGVSNTQATPIHSNTR